MGIKLIIIDEFNRIRNDAMIIADGKMRRIDKLLMCEMKAMMVYDNI